jgi:DNA-binding transcriptional regulator YiaG
MNCDPIRAIQMARRVKSKARRQSTRSHVGAAIRKARTTVQLTQDQLGKRIGIAGRAVHRWEMDRSAPTRRHRQDLVSAIQVLNPVAAAALAEAFNPKTATAAQVAAAQAAPVAINHSEALAMAVFRIADELDLPARRVRRPLARLIGRLREVGLNLESTQEYLDAWIAEER